MSIPLHHACEAHERHGEDAGGDEGDGGAFHALRGFHQLDVLTDAGEDDQRQGKAQGDADGIDHRLAEAQYMGHAAIVELLGDHGQRHAQHGAVGRNQRQEHAQGSVERRADFLQDDLHHLHQGGDDEDEGDGLHEFVQPQGNQDVLVHEPGHQGGQGQHEDDGCAHAQGRGGFLGGAQEGANAQELAEDHIVDQNGRKYDDKVFHGLVIFFLELVDDSDKEAEADESAWRQDEEQDVGRLGQDVQAEDGAAAEELAHAAQHGQGQGEAQAHAGSIENRRPHGVLRGKSLSTTEHDAVHHDERDEESEGLVDVGYVGLHDQLHDGHK